MCICIGKGDKRVGSENKRTLSILGGGWIGAMSLFVFGLHMYLFCCCCSSLM